MEGVVRAREVSTSKSEEVGNIRQYILSTIEEVVGSNSKNMIAAIDYSNTTLPKQWENYISFCDLVFVAKHVNRMNWTTFLLQDYPKELHIPPNAEENKENTHGQDVSNIAGAVVKEGRTWKYLPIEKIRKREECTGLLKRVLKCTETALLTPEFRKCGSLREGT